ncbi:MAG: tetratricopeptide repeat protein [Nitrospirae bacterium]|nr:tetratricopeptide repeat protein [Nitrospirota bacterium]
MRPPFYAILGFMLALSILAAPARAAEPQSEAAKSVISGTGNYKAGEYNKALDDFTKARELLPDDPDVLFYLGMTYMKLTEPERAAEFFQMALDKKPDFTDASFQLGSTHVIMKEYAESIPHLEAVRDREPGKLNLGYMLGLAYYNTGQFDKALDSFEKANVTDKKIVSLNLYYTGLTKVRLGKLDEAESAYKELINVDPASPLAPSSERLMDVLAAVAQSKKKFHVQMTAKMQYDTNAILEPTADVPGILNIGDKARRTPVEFLYLRGDYSALQTKNDDISISYSLLNTFNNNADGVDFQDHIFSISELHKGIAWKKPYYLRATYTYDHALLDYSCYLNRHTFRPSFTLIESPKHLTLIQYSLQGKNFVNTPPVREEERDAINQELGLVHYMRYAGDRHYMYGGYFRDKESASGENWSYLGDKFMAGGQYTLPGKFRLNLDYSYKVLDFDNENSMFNKQREDHNHILSATLTKELVKNLFVSLEFLYNRSVSSLPLYDFQKRVYSIGAVWRF